LRRKLTFLNIVLLAGITFTGYKLREQYIADQIRIEKSRRQKGIIVPAAAAIATPNPESFTGLPYADIAQKDLFSKDRNPNVVIEVPPPKPAKVMPPLPQVAGVMGLPSGMMALMSERHEVHPHGVRINEVVGDFKVLGITPQVISFEWDGKRIDRNVEELLARAPVPAASAIPVAGESQPEPPPASARPTPVAMGAGIRGCARGDKSPPGTIADGYKKISEPTPFGDACRWVQIQ